MKQHTVKRAYQFKGKGLHTGVPATLRILPAPEDYGVRFRRTDLGDGAMVRALATNVGNVTLNTTLEERGVRVILVEHLLSALAGLGVDNALIELDSIEVPVLDGSALPYVEAIAADGLEEQQAERKFLEITRAFKYKDRQSDAWIAVEPCERFEAQLTIDFDSPVVGVQTCSYDSSMDYATQIAPCRTFCFFSQLEQLSASGFIKGGDMDNAIVVVDRDASAAEVSRVAKLFNVPGIEIRKGYLSNVEPHFENECARHKVLDLIGDFSLAGAPLKARVTAYKPGHRVNARAVNLILKQLSQDTL